MNTLEMVPIKRVIAANSSVLREPDANRDGFSKAALAKKKKGERSYLLTCLLAYFLFLSVVVEGAYVKRFFA
jgi:hypothetical protein